MHSQGQCMAGTVGRPVSGLLRGQHPHPSGGAQVRILLTPYVCRAVFFPQLFAMLIIGPVAHEAVLHLGEGFLWDTEAATEDF